MLTKQRDLESSPVKPKPISSTLKLEPVDEDDQTGKVQSLAQDISLNPMLKKVKQKFNYL